VKAIHSLTFVAALSLLPSLVQADEPSPAEWALKRVEEGLLKPLAEQETHRFSRARPMPHERRTRVSQGPAVRDKSGRPFVAFAIDVRFGGEWHENDIVGCAYTATGNLFVKRGDAYRPAAFLLGKDVGPVAGVCEAAAPTASRS
jgi:hypothetical protein